MHLEDRYANLVMEKKVEWRFFQGSPIFNMFNQKEWDSILIDLVCPIEELVLDFYANLRC